MPTTGTSSHCPPPPEGRILKTDMDWMIYLCYLWNVRASELQKALTRALKSGANDGGEDQYEYFVPKHGATVSNSARHAD